MYGFLDFNVSTGAGITATVPAWIPMAEAVSSPEFAARKKKCLPLVQELCRGEPDLLTRVARDVTNILALGEPLPLEFAVHMCVAHHRLPQAHRDKRMATIQRTVDGHFSDLQRPSPAVVAAIANLKQMAILVPDAVLEDELRSECFEIARSISLTKLPPAGYDVVSLTGAILTKLKTASLANLNDLVNDLVNAWLSRAPAERVTLRQKILTALDQKLGSALAAACIQLKMWPKTPPLLAIHRFDFYEDVITHALANPGDAWSTFVAARAAALDAKVGVQVDVVLWTSVAAVIEGVSMGPYSASSMDALSRRAQVSTGIRAGFTTMRTRKARALGTGDVHQLSEPDALELNSVQSMSVDQLVRWIEGPLVEIHPSEMKRIDRKAIVQREQSIRAKTPTPQAAPNKAPLPQTPLTDEDVEETIRDALAATARFFLDEVNDLLVLSKSIDATPELITACAGMQEVLSQLVHKPEAFEEEGAREILCHAEASVVSLRHGLKQAQASALVSSRFPGQLSAALKAELKVLGKRHGGQIACPVRFDDWAFVANAFHDRWLPDVKSIQVDGKAMPLDNDQAAALYVTGSSQSGFAFDVSVHLWRRRQGRTSLPSLEDGLYPPMNGADWFDTYQTCCVLHVPLAH